jgi:hypothetical protein
VSINSVRMPWARSDILRETLSGRKSAFRFGSACGFGYNARNLDWWFPGNLLKEHVVINRMFNAPQGDYTTVSWPGLFGVLTAVAKGRFSVSVNHVKNRRNGRASMAARALGGYWPVMWAVRKALDECGNFDSVVDFLSGVPLLSPVLFAIAGVNPSQAVVIERTPERSAVRETVGCESACVTSHYATDEFSSENDSLEALDTI